MTVSAPPAQADDPMMAQSNALLSVVAAEPAALQSNKNQTKLKARQATKLTRKTQPPRQQIDTLVALYSQERFAEAQTLARSLTIRFPRHALGWTLLGAVLQQQGRFEEALLPLQTAAELLPQDVAAQGNLGLVLNALGRLPQAEASYRRALALKPAYAAAQGSLGVLLRSQGRYTEAEARYRRALELKPDDAVMHGNLGTLLQDQGRLAEAEASYRRVLELKPDDAVVHSALLFTLSQNEAVDAVALFAEHCRFGAQFEAPLRSQWQPHSNSRAPERGLRVGFVSADLRNHAVAYFIEPVLAHLATYASLSLHAYANHRTDDSVTQRLRGYVKHWHPVLGLSDAALAEKIRADGIDILFDLSNHTSGNRLLTFARKPAPVQISWIGYHGTTGLSSMDYYLTDRFLLPPGQFDHQFTEKLVYLPAWAPFLPSAEAPPVNRLPALSKGYLTFGSFNRQSKISRAVIALWSQLLRAVPDSRMVLGAMLQDGQYDTLIAWFAGEGVARERLDFYPRSNMQDYLALHHQVDLCLDTFPYAGGTTTFHALWMGVPTLTLAGSTVAGHIGAGILGHVGLDAFVAQDASAFVQQGLALQADNFSTLARLRDGLRERFAQSAPGQPALIAAGLERALRTMWQRWCAGLPTETFEASVADMSVCAALHSNKNQTQLKARQATKLTRKTQPPQQQIDTLVALYSQERFAEAETLARSLTLRFPRHGFSWKVLGAVLQQQGRLAQALLPMQTAAELLPQDTEAHSNLGITLKSQGRLIEAEASHRRALELSPACAQVHNNLGVTLKSQGRLTEAEACCQRALVLNPAYVEAHSNLGNIFKELGRLSEAEAHYRQALELTPTYVDGHNNLGVLLQQQGRLTQSELSYRRALELNPAYVDGYNNLGALLQGQGRLIEAEASLRQALALKPDDAASHSALLFTLSQNEAVDAAALFSEYCHFGAQFEAPLRSQWQPHSNSRAPERCLHVGFVSADLRNHAVAYFIEPVLAHLATYASLSLHAYANHRTDDSVTQRLRGYVKHWHPVLGLSDAALAEKIRADGIDILFDLSNHTSGNRLLTFARKPAPVQISWIGYHGTTGLSSMDYYLTDRFLLPPGQFDHQFTEKLVYLPAWAPFLPSAEAPPVNRLPALSKGYLTFGSFNRQSKISRAVIALWSQLLRAVPDSRMVLGAMRKDGQYDTLIAWFAGEGVARERLDFYPRSNMQDYLALHHQVDLCLDTFPYAGGTTTFHALWMGVPTLTLAGSTVAGHIGAGILGHVGLDAFVAQDASAFVQQGLALQGDNFSTLARLRDGLRERFAQSAPGQPALIAAGLERALRTMWQRWCVGLPTETFEASVADMTISTPPAQPVEPAMAQALKDLEQSLAQALQLAVNHQQSGQIEEAEMLYRGILQAQPKHAAANHGLGLMEINSQGTLAALPRLEIAVMENPENEPFWISYIGALIQSGSADSVADALELGLKYGLRNETAQALAADFVTILESNLASRQDLAAAPAIGIHIHQIYYSKQTQRDNDSGFIGLDNLANPRPDWSEYWSIRNYLLKTPLNEDGYYGFFSPRFKSKTKLDAAAVHEFVNAFSDEADVFLFPPYFDQGAFFLNVFEQGERGHPGIMTTFQACVAMIAPDVNLAALVMDSRNTVYCNYIVAKPAFWKVWLESCELIFAIAEENKSVLASNLNASTNYHGGVAPHKVFVIERIASLLLSTQSHWKVKAYYPTRLPYSNAPIAKYPHELLLLDALKIASVSKAYPDQYLSMFLQIRQSILSSIEKAKS